MSLAHEDFFSALAEWVVRTPELKSAVLFGSSARARNEPAARHEWSDFDLHVVATDPLGIESVRWEQELPNNGYCFQVARPATGGVRKVTAVFRDGQIDVVVISERMLRLARLGFRCGLHRKIRRLEIALSEFATCLHSGYRFIKGERVWGDFYARVAELPGVRSSDDQISELARISLCDALWVLQKIERGELIAAQHWLHTRLVDTNLRLMRELRLRRGQPLPSFGLGRRVETLATPNELKWVQADARPTAEELRRAACQCLSGLNSLMAELQVDWKILPETHALLVRHGVPATLLK